MNFLLPILGWAAVDFYLSLSVLSYSCDLFCFSGCVCYHFILVCLWQTRRREKITCAGYSQFQTSDPPSSHLQALPPQWPSLRPGWGRLRGDHRCPRSACLVPDLELGTLLPQPHLRSLHFFTSSQEPSPSYGKRMTNADYSHFIDDEIEVRKVSWGCQGQES